MVADYAVRKHAEAHRRAKRNYYSRLKADGLCTTGCGRQAVAGKSLCPVHLEQAAKRSKAKRRKNRAAGGCEHCGAKVKETERLCPMCRSIALEHQRAWRQQNEEDGMCYLCGKRKPKPGRRKCPVCTKALNLAKRRAWMRKKRTGQLRRLLANPAAIERLAGLMSGHNRFRSVGTAAD